LIQDGLRTLRCGRTTFVIAHRLSTVRTADQILVMESGGIVEHGRHEELTARDGRYRRLYESQHSRGQGRKGPGCHLSSAAALGKDVTCFG
jgi:ABC-type multidrug transport system fused ATPase/permease subunit